MLFKRLSLFCMHEQISVGWSIHDNPAEHYEKQAVEYKSFAYLVHIYMEMLH